jgi:hypothetical protein
MDIMGSIEFTTGMPDRMRVSHDGDGISVDFFDRNSTTHVTGRRLKAEQVKELVQFLAPAEVAAAHSETTTERMPVAHMSELQVGDVVETVYNRDTLHAYVTRQVPKPVEPAFGFGTAYVFGGSLLNHGEQQKRYRGFRSESGNFYYLTDDGKQRNAWAGQFEGFRIEV